MEKAWADALAEGKKVEVDIEPMYDIGNTTARPNSFQITEIIDGVPGTRTIDNF